MADLTLIPVDHDPFGPDSLAAKAYHAVVDPWTAPLDGYKGQVLPFSIEKGRAKFDSNAGMLGGLKSGTTLPGDVYAGKVDPNSAEGFARTQELAGMLSGGPLAGGAEGAGTRAAVGWNKWPENFLEELNVGLENKFTLQDLHKGMQTQYLFMSPARLRYPWAKFDPNALDSSNLTHVGGLPITLIPTDQDPWSQQ